jgi:protein-tyrosine phosphatase
MKIVTGPYPLYEVDVESIVNKGKIDAVLNLMTDTEMKMRGLNDNQLREWYQNKGVKDYIRHPMLDMNTRKYVDSLFEASKALDSLRENDRTVYVHSCAGQSRCTTLAAFYLCLFMKAKNWQNKDEVLGAVKLSHNGCSPNANVYNLALKKFKPYQQEILDRLRRQREEEERRRR